MLLAIDLQTIHDVTKSLINTDRPQKQNRNSRYFVFANLDDESIVWFDEFLALVPQRFGVGLGDLALERDVMLLDHAVVAQWRYHLHRQL